MTQQDQHSENGASPDSADDVQDSRPEDVTREQGGQFMEESEEMTLPTGAIEAQAEARLDREAAGTVNALQVTLDRSGAEEIHAQRVAMTNAGAKSIETKTAKLNQSAAIVITTEKADLTQSSSLVVVADDELHLDRSTAFIGVAEKATLGDDNRVGVLTVGDLKADGNVRAFFLMSGNVEAGGNVQTTLTGVSAAALGAGLGVVLFLLRRLFDSRG